MKRCARRRALEVRSAWHAWRNPRAAGKRPQAKPCCTVAHAAAARGLSSDIRVGRLPGRPDEAGPGASGRLFTSARVVVRRGSR